MGASPPLVVVASKVNDPPSQIADDVVEAMITLAANEELTSMVIGLEVAGLFEAQLALDVKMQVTISPAISELLL